MTIDNHHLIPIAELVKQAKAAGYIFGKGNPKNRLRYFTKLSLIPRAVRLRAGQHDAFTVGYYPAYTVHLLLQLQYLEKQGRRKKEEGKRNRVDSCQAATALLPSASDLFPSAFSVAAAQRGALPAGEHRSSRPHGRVEPSSPLVTTPPPPQLSWRGGGHTTQERLHWAAAGTTEAATVETVNLRMIRAITHYLVPASILAMLTLAINHSYIAPSSPTLPPHPPAAPWAKLAAERQLKLGQRNLPEATRPELASTSGPEGLVAEPEAPTYRPIPSSAMLATSLPVTNSVASIALMQQWSLLNRAPSATSGSGQLESGQTGVEIANPAATPNSRILITPTTVTAQPLAVINKRVGNFTVTLPTATKHPVTFDWFILAQ